MRCAPHGRQLCVAFESTPAYAVPDCMLTEMLEQWWIVDVTGSRDDLFRLHGCCVRRKSEWVEDTGGKKLLWLPPNWRVGYYTEARFDDDFLALVGGHRPVPIIIEFQPQLLPHSIHSSGTEHPSL